MTRPINPDPALSPQQERLRWVELEARLRAIERKQDNSPQFGAAGVASTGSYLTGQTLVGVNAIATNVVQQLGFAAALIGSNFSTANSSTFALIPSSTFNFTVPNIQNRALTIVYFVHATAQLVAGTAGQLGYIQGNIAGFSATAELKFGSLNSGLVPGTIWYFPPNGIPPGNYSAWMQVATDTSGVSCHIDQIFHQIWTMGSAT